MTRAATPSTIRTPSVAASRGRIAPTGADTFTAAMSSARVGPMLTTATGSACSCARRTKRKPGVDGERRADHQQRLGLGRTASHAAASVRSEHGAAEEDDVGLELAAAQPAARRPRSRRRARRSARRRRRAGCRRRAPASPGWRRAGAPAARAAARRARSAGSATSASAPCSSTTRRLPARWCRRSTFCVITPASGPAALSAASARCAAFGCARRRTAPTQRRARPVAPPHVRLRHERVVLDRIARAGAAAAAVVGDAGLGAAAGAGQRDEAAAGQQIDERRENHRRERRERHARSMT